MAVANDPFDKRSILCDKLATISENEIRLVTLHPGVFVDEIKCNLSVAPLTADYEALSYTWSQKEPIRDPGDWQDIEEQEWEDVDDVSNALEDPSVGDAETIVVNDVPIKVMKNLFLALQHLRMSSKIRTLWIDYLCINQESVLDRNTQVARMDRIYRSASRVVVWLGLESDDCSQALGELLGLAANVHLSTLYPSSLDETTSRLRPLLRLLRRPWFSRVWVVQEVALAKEAVVQLGNRTAPWEWFIRAARVYRDHMSCCATIITPFNDSEGVDEFLALKNCLAGILALDGEALRSISLHSALRLFYDRQATDPRDKVYGLLGLLDHGSRLVSADYAILAEDVYEEAAFKVIESSGDLSILTDIDEYVGDVPAASWAPDWTTNAAYGLDLYDLFSAAGHLRADVRRCSQHTLKISGLIFDTVTNVLPATTDQDDPNEGELFNAISRLKSWEALAEPFVNGPSPYASGQERKNVFWQTILMGASADRSRRVRKNDQTSYQKWRMWLEQYMKASNREALLAAAAKEKDITDHNSMLSLYQFTRWFFLTEDGYFGLGPVEMEQDDVVCVLAGGKMPFVLRAINESCEVCNNDQLCYRLLGFAYVHGIMDGETVRGIEADEEEGIDFCIR